MVKIRQSHKAKPVKKFPKKMDELMMSFACVCKNTSYIYGKEWMYLNHRAISVI